MGDSAISMAKMAIEYILIAVFLALAIRFIQIRNSYADALNSKDISESQIRNYLEFSKYDVPDTSDDNLVSGDIVVEALRNYKDGRIEVYVITGGAREIRVTSTHNAITNPDDFSLAKMFNAPALSTDWIKVKELYQPYIVYDAVDPSTVYSKQVPGAEITGLVFRYVKNAP